MASQPVTTNPSLSAYPGRPHPEDRARLLFLPDLRRYPWPDAQRMVPERVLALPGPQTEAPARDYTGATRPLERDAENGPSALPDCERMVAAMNFDNLVAVLAVAAAVPTTARQHGNAALRSPGQA